jgi:hypothetical protein
VAQDGRLFRTENRTPIQPSTWWQVWQKVRAASLTPEQLASPLMRTYARCVTGMDDVWITRMDKTLHPEEDQ